MATEKQIKEKRPGDAGDDLLAADFTASTPQTPSRTSRNQIMMVTRLSIAIALITGSLYAQQFRVTADLLSPQTTAAMFGKLPARYSAANVSVCNQTNNPVTVALSLAAQQTRTSGVVLLPRDAALSVIAAAQGSSAGNRALRVGITVVQLAAIAAGWSTIGPTMKNTLTSAALAGSSTVSVLSTAIPTHTYLVFTNEALPDPLPLAALGCATGTVIVETASGKTKVDAMFSLPNISNAAAGVQPNSGAAK